MTARVYESLPTAATRIGVSVKTIRRRIAEGVLPVYRCGRILRLDPDDVDAMFRRCPQSSATPPRLRDTLSFTHHPTTPSRDVIATAELPLARAIT